MRHSCFPSRPGWTRRCRRDGVDVVRAGARPHRVGTRDLRRQPRRAGATERVRVRLEQPLRVALAGSVKAGKSTLLNAFVGQDIAPTDATECTRVVTWYRGGTTPTVTARYDGAESANVAVQRHAGRLTFDLGDLTADRVDRLDVEWPASALAQTTIIDTPGTSSLSKDVSARTLEMLTPENAVSGADAVVYLLRSLSASDVQFLGRIGAHVGGESGPLGVVGVVSRADEVGAGRADAMLSAKEIAARFTAELERTGLCQAVVPVAGLSALGARTLRQSEFAAFEALARVPGEDLQLAMLSADRFAAATARCPWTRRSGAARGPVRPVRDPARGDADPARVQDSAQPRRRVGRPQRTRRTATGDRRAVRPASRSTQDALRARRARTGPRSAPRPEAPGMIDEAGRLSRRPRVPGDAHARPAPQRRDRPVGRRSDRTAAADRWFRRRAATRLGLGPTPRSRRHGTWRSQRCGAGGPGGASDGGSVHGPGLSRRRPQCRGSADRTGRDRRGRWIRRGDAARHRRGAVRVAPVASTPRR